VVFWTDGGDYDVQDIIYVNLVLRLRTATDRESVCSTRDWHHPIPRGDAMRRLLAALLVSLLVFPHVTSGQGMTTAARLVPGARVRITHPAEGVRVGTALAVTEDQIFVRWADGTDTVGVPLAEVTHLDVSAGSPRFRALKYAGIGLVAGAAVGAMAGAASYDDGDALFGRGALAAIGATMLGSLGGVIGLLSGIVHSDPWQEVPLDRTRVGIVAPPGGHGTRLGLAFAF
jgi:hypothetical protein